MRIIAVSNIKGGVGKTTTAVNLAYLCAASGSRTVLWDLDTQGAASWILRADPAQSTPVHQLPGSDSDPGDMVLHTAHKNLDVIPAGFSYAIDARAAEQGSPTKRLLRMRRMLAEHYDTLLMDCPPGISLLSESVLRGADALIVPLLPTPLSVRMLEQLLAFITRNAWPDLKLLPVFSMVDRRKSLHYEVLSNMRSRFPQMLNTSIPYSSDIERIAERRAPLNAFAPNSEPGKLYETLWAEIEQRLAQ